MYVPKLDDYVEIDHMKGWVYCVLDEYFTLEIMVRKKSQESYQDSDIHRNDRCLVVVYREDWNRVKYLKSR